VKAENNIQLTVPVLIPGHRKTWPQQEVQCNLTPSTLKGLHRAKKN